VEACNSEAQGEHDGRTRTRYVLSRWISTGGRRYSRTNDALLAELRDVLSRTKFARLLAQHSTSSEELATEYAALGHTITSAPIPPTVVADLDDDAVLACAVAAQAEAIVSGDDHLLSLKGSQGILILTANELLGRVTPPPA
jgi:putative PIN family toxin of toxin-antitoxin system